MRLVKDPTKRQEGKEALRAVDKEVRNLQDEVRRCELNLNQAHAGEWSAWCGVGRNGDAGRGGVCLGRGQGR